MSNWRNDPATDRQKEYAKELGITIPCNATKGYASDLISKAEQERNVYNPSFDVESKKKSLFSKIKKIFTSSFKKQSRYVPKPTHAIKGSFDISYFINPKTGNFQFPKYIHDNRFLIKITDITEYDYWDGLDAVEKRNYTMEDFEDECCPDIEVEPFKSLFYKSSTDHLKPLQYLKGQWSLIEEIITNQHYFLVLSSNTNVGFKLLNDGFLFEQVIASIEDKIRYFDSFKITELRDACKKAGVKGGKNKQEIIDRMIQSEKEFDLPKAVIPAPHFINWLDNLIDFYISDIRKNADRFHPLFIEEIWEQTLDLADFPALENKVQLIRNSNYWLDRLHY